MKRIALVAHSSQEEDLLEWARRHREVLIRHELHATGRVARLLEDELGVSVTIHHTNPLAGEQQIGGLIIDRIIDGLVFFWDPLTSGLRDPHVMALFRTAVFWNIPFACNRASADVFVASQLVVTMAPHQPAERRALLHRVAWRRHRQPRPCVAEARARRRKDRQARELSWSRGIECTFAASAACTQLSVGLPSDAHQKVHIV